MSVVDVAISSYFEKRVIPFISERTIDNIYYIIWFWNFIELLIIFFPNGLYVSDLIEYVYILLNIGYDNFIISAGCDEMHPVEFSS